jgi:hypothetical protein
MQTPDTNLPNTGDKTPRPTAADFKGVLTATTKTPEDGAGALAWLTEEPFALLYNGEVTRLSLYNWPPMTFCYPDPTVGIACLLFDHSAVGTPCAVENKQTGELYTKMQVLWPDDSLGEETELSFTPNTVVLLP